MINDLLFILADFKIFGSDFLIKKTLLSYWYVQLLTF